MDRDKKPSGNIRQIIGSYLCKIGIHLYKYTYNTSLGGWSTYDGYCKRCGKRVSGMA